MKGGETLAQRLGRCCAAHRWIDAMVASAPWSGREALLRASDSAFDHLEAGDWLEAFSGHPRIGDVGALSARHADVARSEQAATATASQATLHALAEANARYDERFGHLFLVFASGKSAEEMLGLLEARLGNAPDEELRIASDEQRKITRKRLSDDAERILAAAHEATEAGEEVP